MEPFPPWILLLPLTWISIYQIFSPTLWIGSCYYNLDYY